MYTQEFLEKLKQQEQDLRFASFDLETMMPLSPPPVMTQTGLPCNFGSLTRSQDTKKQSQSIKATIRCIRTRVEHLTQKVNSNTIVCSHHKKHCFTTS